MRKQFIKTTLDLLESNPRVVLLLGDIGVYGFREAFEKYPQRVYNLGVNEQAMVGMAAGMAGEGYIPIVYTIAPFLVERAYEQIKLDIGYQERKVILVSVGASYDYAGCGATHHCPADVGLIYNVPGIDIFVPGKLIDVDYFLRKAVKDSSPCYIRLSERYDSNHEDVLWDEPCQIVILAVGPTFEMAIKASKGINSLLIYQRNVRPFNPQVIWNIIQDAGCFRIVVIEPYYPVLSQIIAETASEPFLLRSIGVPRRFERGYGSPEDLERAYGLDAEGIRRQIEEFIHG